MPASSPATASAMCSRDVMTARRAAGLDEAEGGVDLGAHAAAGELAGGGVLAQLGDGDPAQRPGGRRAEVDHHVRDVGGDDEGVGVDLAGQDRGGEVLVDDGLDAAQRRRRPRPSSATGMPPPPAQTTTKPAAASAWIAGESTTDCGSGEATTRRQPFSPRSSQTWPSATNRSASSRGRKRPTGLDGSRKCGSSASTSVRVTRPAVRCGRPAGGQRRVELVGEGEGDRRLGLRDVPVQRHRRDDVRGHLVLDQQVADLGAVAVGQHDLDAGGDDVGDVARGLADRVPLGAGRRRAVGAGHGVAAEGDHDATGGHSRTLAADSLAVK